MTAARIPSDVDREDRMLAGLTARQLAVLAPTALGAWLVVTAARSVAPLPVAAATAIPVAVLGLALALGQRDGLPGDRFARAALAYLRTPKRKVLAPEGITRLPAWIDPGTGNGAVAPLDFPANDVHDGGIVDLGHEGSALVARAGSVNFSLRSEAEQEALTAAFGRFLHALSGPVQVVARADRADLAPLVAELEDAANSLPDQRLREAAGEHAGFLAALGARRDVLWRETFVVLRHPAPPQDAEGPLARRLDEAAAMLRASGVTLSALDADGAAAVLRRCSDPAAPALAPETTTTGVVRASG